ncbi:MAG: protein translocase subunit SecDF, partial [Flavobacteriia bacterium]|nr:protein translocase subunit SecDF [Flavobacteriia bacterium]
MQNNSLIRVFGILFALVSIYQLSFTFIASRVEQQAETYAAQSISEDIPNYLELRDISSNAYLDSVGNNNLYGFTTYNSAKGKELNKGLDLKGGINVILQISIRDILSGLAENSKNPVFNRALDEADVLQKSTDEPYIESFFSAFNSVKGSEKLAAPDIFANRTLSDEINFEMTDQETQVVLRRKIDESIVSAFEVLRKRIDKFGVTQPNIQRLGTSGRILVELPGAKDVDRVKNLLQSTAQLEFWETFKGEELINFLLQANEILKEDTKATSAKAELEEKDAASEIDDLLADIATQDSIISNSSNPILDRIVGQGYQGGPVLAQFAARDSDLIL